MDEITEIVGGLVSQINGQITGELDPMTGLNLFCNTKWARKGKVITSGSDSFRINEIIYDDYIVAQSIPIGTPFNGGTYDLPTPFYISGTRLATDREWTLAASNLMNKTPIIWLLETIEEQRFGRGDSREFETSLRIFFLDETNIKDFYTKDHRHEVVLPMQKLVGEFLNVVNEDRRFKTVEEYKLKTFSRFGVEQENGMFQNILDANLSGVELNVTLTKFKQNCKC